jgi:ESCRT-I complex subunit TSG101
LRTHEQKIQRRRNSRVIRRSVAKISKNKEEKSREEGEKGGRLFFHTPITLIIQQSKQVREAPASQPYNQEAMVQDPRVSTLLSRLGGLYRDPSRVDRDASSLLKSSVGVHLAPGIAPLVENNGDTSNCLVMQGTIAIVFRGNTYQLLVDIYLPPGYPIRPPVSYVRLAQNMYLKENHPHVGSDGMVYMPYLHEWNGRTHSLIEMVVAMSSVFSADPPVFTRSAPAPPPPPPAYDPGIISRNNTNYTSNNTTNNSASNTASELYMQEQIEKIMAQEAAEANAAADAVRSAERRAEQEAQERERQLTEQKAWEGKKRDQVQDQVNQKILAHLRKVAAEAKTTVQSDWRDQQLLKLSQESIDQEIEDSHNLIQKLEGTIAEVDTKTTNIEEWLEESKNASEQEVSVDDLCRPATKVHSQMLNLSSENAAITDALYFLDRGMFMGHIECSTHLKSVRKLAKRQFLVRAHLVKINQVLIQNGNS